MAIALTEPVTSRLLHDVGMRRAVKSLLFGCVVSLAPLVAARGAHAQETPAPPSPAPSAPTAPPNPAAQADAQKAMELGVEAARANRHEEALGHYRRAASLVPEANLPHRFAADSLEAMKRWEEAIVELEEYLRIKPNVKDASAVRQRIEEIRDRHVVGTLDVVCTPDGATVTIDDADAPRGTTPLRGIKVKAGVHKIVIHAGGHRDLTSSATVAAGSTHVVQCALDRITAAPPGALGPLPGPGDGNGRQPGGDKKSIFGHWLFWTGIGAVAVGATVAIVLASTSGNGNEPPSTAGGTLRFP